jgi:hypothetical protein
VPSERSAVIGGIIAGMFFVAVLAITSYSLESQPPKVVLVVDGIPHYGALRNYDWESASGGGGSHYVGKIPETAIIRNGSAVCISSSWDRQLVEISCVKIKDSTCFVYKQRNSQFEINAPPGENNLDVMSAWKGKLSERVSYEYLIKVQ